MDMSRPLQIVAGCPFNCLPAAIVSSSSGQSRYDPAPRQRSSKAHDNFLDFTLKRNQPHGYRLRAVALLDVAQYLFEKTIKNGYFWSNIVALSLLTCLFVIIVYQHRIQTKREWASAEMLAQFEQSLFRSNAQLDEATKRNQSTDETLRCCASPHYGLRFRSRRLLDLPHHLRLRLEQPTCKRWRRCFQAPTPPKPTNGRAVATATTTQAGDQMRLFKSDADLIIKVNSLEQQLAHLTGTTTSSLRAG